MAKAEQTKEFIVARTAPIFNRKGIAGTSLSDMTDATGLTKGSIYGNFSGKDEVALAAFDYNLKKIHDVVNAETARHNSPKEKLLAQVEVYSNFVRYPFPEGGCPILNTATESDDTHPALRKKAVEAILQWKESMATLIKEGIALKQFKKTTDAEKAAISIVAIIEGMIMIAKLTGNTRFRKDIMDTAKDLVNQL